MTQPPAIPAPRLPPSALVDDGRLAAARAAIDDQRYVEARELLLDLLRSRPDAVPVLTQLATVSMLTGDSGGAAQFADAALRITPGSPRLLSMRATALAALGRRDEARRVADAAIAYEPRSAEAYAARAGADLREHSVAGYAEVLATMARARAAAVHPSPYSVLLTARFATALDGLGARADARRILADLVAEHPESATVRVQAAEVESVAWNWRRTVAHLAVVLDDPGGNGSVLATASRRCASAVRLWLVEVAGLSSILLVIGVIAQTWLGAAGPAFAAGALATNVALLVSAFGAILRGRRHVFALAVRSPAAVLSSLLIAAMLAGQVVSLIRVATLTHTAAIWLLAVGGVLAFGAATDLIGRVSSAIGHRYRARRNRDLIVSAVSLAAAPVTPPHCLTYPVAVPTPGSLSLAGIPVDAAARQAATEALATGGVDLLVSTLRTSLSPRPRERPDHAVEVVRFPIEAGRPPREPEFDALVATIVARLRSGSSVALVCRTGAERSALVAASVCVRLGLRPGVAWSHVEASRGVELAISPTQRVWLDGFAERHGAAPATPGDGERASDTTMVMNIATA